MGFVQIICAYFTIEMFPGTMRSFLLCVICMVCMIWLICRRLGAEQSASSIGGHIYSGWIHTRTIQILGNTL